MSRPPFGFNPPGAGDDDSGAGGGGPEGMGDLFAMLGDPEQMSRMLHHFADMMSWQGGPVNWNLAKDVARHAVAGGDPSVVGGERQVVEEALRLADLWLEEATVFPSGITATGAWSRAEWIEATLPVWSQLCDPIAARAVESLSGTFSLGGSLGGPLGGPPGEQGGQPGDAVEELPPQMRAFAPLLGMAKQMGGVMVGAQTGQAIGGLAREVVGSCDIGLPVGPAGTAALLPAGVAAFGAGLEVPLEEVRLFLALREAAHHRLFGHVPWLRAHLLGAVEEYARGISVDTRKLEEALGGIDPTDPESVQRALAGGALFEPETTPRQKAALARLETTLALVEGWVAAVVGAAARRRLPNADALAEAVRRRRATGGPAEHTFATLVGLELRPRRLREAAALWDELLAARGIAGRDAVWAHPDLMPTTEDLDDPASFIQGPAEIDISDLVDGDGDDRPGGGGDDRPGDGGTPPAPGR